VAWVRAKFDSAQTTAENRRHWANADGCSPDAAASPSVRAILRNRARYEVANNSYARGILLTLANDVIGSGPRLQMLDESAAVNRTVEREWALWASAAGLAAKLRTMRLARGQDGEAFGLFTTNPALPSPVKLDLRLLEADQVAAQPGAQGGLGETDGILLDEAGNPAAYSVLGRHPGSLVGPFLEDYRMVPAAQVIHWFRQDRPGQSRGLPEILPALPLFAQLRRYTLAVLGAAESAADVAIVMKTTAPPGGEAAEVEKMAEMDFQPRTAVFAPEGWEPSQIKAEQPATTYDTFKREILNEIARCLNMPYNIAACNSSSYNYASGRLDHQTYFKSLRVEQLHCEVVVLDRILGAWLREAQLSLGLGDLGELARVPHQWFWEGREHVDPAKEASADDTRLGNGTLSLPSYWARQGRDWETEQAAQAASLGLTVEELRRRLADKLLSAKPGAAAAGPAGEPAGQPIADEEAPE
jgi:capsid protein